MNPSRGFRRLSSGLRNSLSAAVCLIWLCHAPLGAAEPAKPDRREVFKRIGDVELSLHFFLPEDWQPETDRRPAIVFFFGGGWVAGSPEQFYPHARRLADRGMVACCAEYRVRSRHGTSPVECVRDGKSAVRFLRAEARQWGIDPQRIVAAGGSAGGHVAAGTATLPMLDEADEDDGISSRPDALALFNPVVDTSRAGFGHRVLQDRWRELSPLEHLQRGTPPTIIFHGTDDSTVPIDNVRRFAERMKQLGNRCELIEYAGQGHGFFNFNRPDNRYAETLGELERFLVSLDYLDAPARTE